MAAKDVGDLVARLKSSKGKEEESGLLVRAITLLEQLREEVALEPKVDMNSRTLSGSCLIDCVLHFLHQRQPFRDRVDRENGWTQAIFEYLQSQSATG